MKRKKAVAVSIVAMTSLAVLGQGQYIYAADEQGQNENGNSYQNTAAVTGYAEGSTDLFSSASDTVYNGIDYSAVYDKSYYMEHNSDVVDAYGDDSQMLLWHFVNYGMNEGRRANEAFDVQAYENLNKDLYQIYGDNVSSYYYHYMNSGIAEGRLGNIDAVYDKSYYEVNNQDVVESIGSDSWSLIWHFVNFGMKEGRQGCASFNQQQYKARYAELNAAFGNDNQQYYMHFLYFGQNEGRSGLLGNVLNSVDYSAVYDKEYYMEHNSDVKAAFGDNSLALLEHFVNYGMAEGRQAIADFNVKTYKSNYSDLVSA